MATGYSLHQRDQNRTRLFHAYDNVSPGPPGASSSSSQGRSSPFAGRPGGFGPAGTNIPPSYRSSPGLAPAGSFTPGSRPGENSNRSPFPDDGRKLSARDLRRLEGQPDPDLGAVKSRIRMLAQLSEQIGDHINESDGLLAAMSDQFKFADAKVKSTMRRMLRAADATGISWKAWLVFFGLVCLLFWYTWL